MTRPSNFYPGPGALPLAVLRQVQAELLDYAGTGLSVMELSHRSSHMIELIDDTVRRIKRLLALGDDFEVLLLQGGASLQFCMVPMNLSVAGQRVAYIDTGYWASKAIEEAGKMHREVVVIASSEDGQYTYVPKVGAIDVDARYLHICSNNTIYGTSWKDYPASNVPLVADMSSDMTSRVVDYRQFGIAYAHAQKMLGPAGVTVVLIKRGLLERCEKDIPNILSYGVHSQHKSNYHTPPCFAIYVMNRVLRWIEHEVGGMAALERLNGKKAALLYECVDSSELYESSIEPESRSLVNVVFRMRNADLENVFVDEAERAGLVGLRGHRKVGGLRASIYNAVSVRDVENLVSFMRDFEKRHGA